MAREMKDSGVEWIRQIPKDWKILKNKNCFTLRKEIVGNTFDEYDLLSLTKLGIKIKDKNDFKGKVPENYGTYQNVKKGELVLCLFDLDCSAVFSGLSEYEGMISPAYKVYNCNKNIFNNFAKYWFEYCFIERKYKIYSKSLRYVVNSDDFGGIEILVPPLEEQEKIANYLDKKVSDIDLIIEKTKATIEDYKKYKQSIITEAVTKGINPNVEMKDSGVEWIGEIPREWEVRKLKTFLSTISKGTTPKEISLFKNEKYQVRYIKSENIVNNIVINIPEFFISVKTHEELKRSQLEENDILIVIAGAGIGKTAILPKSLLPCNTNQAISFLRLNKNFYYKKYIWYVLQSDILKSFILLYSVQSAQPNLSMENLENLKIAISTQEQEIEKIINYLDKKTFEIDTLITKKEALIAELEEYKKSLIYECVTGKKEIK